MCVCVCVCVRVCIPLSICMYMFVSVSMCVCIVAGVRALRMNPLLSIRTFYFLFGFDSFELKTPRLIVVGGLS